MNTFSCFCRKTSMGGICVKGSLQCFPGPTRMAWLAAFYNWSHRRWGGSLSLVTFRYFRGGNANIYYYFSEEGANVNLKCAYAASVAETKEIWYWTQRELVRGRWPVHLSLQGTLSEPRSEGLDKVPIMATHWKGLSSFHLIGYQV